MNGLVPRESRRRRLQRYIVVRFAIILMAFGLGMVYQMGLEPDQKEQFFQFLSIVLGGYTLFGLLSVGVFRLWQTSRAFALIQVGVDFVVGTTLAVSTGGVLSVFCPMLFVSLALACTIVGLRGALGFAASATTCLAVATLGYTLDSLPIFLQISSPRLRWALDREQIDYISAYLIGTGVSLHVVAILGSKLHSGLLNIQILQTEILENIGDGLIAVGPYGRLIEINGAARKIFELEDRGELRGQRLDHVLTEEAAQPLGRILCGNARSRVEIEIPLPSGDTRHIEVRASPIEDDAGRIRCHVGLFRDLSLQKEIEATETRIRQLEELYQMALGIAHEIRNPLASIRGCVQEISRVREDDDASSRLFDIILRESDRLDRNIEEFLCFTRKAPNPARRVDLTEIVDRTVVLLRNHSKLGGRKVVWKNPGAPFWILGDEERLQQVLLNLGINALESTSAHEGRVEIALELRDYYKESGSGHLDEKASGVELTVADNGGGIPTENFEKIFTPFFTNKARGTGLGLALVHRYVHDQGGVIRVESREGKGTRFLVWFPSLTEQTEPVEAALAVEGA